MNNPLKKLLEALTSNKSAVILSFIGLYLLSAGASWAIFSYVRDEPSLSLSSGELRAGIDPNLPKTEECPINGKMYSEPEREIWEERRPLTAIVENHVFARPYSGLSKADVVYEAVAEGGITRLLTVFYCGAAAQDFEIAVIRSARVYYIDWAMEYGENPLFLHWGGANNICNDCPRGVKERGRIAPEVDAFNLLSKIGWRNGQYGNDLDGQTNFGYPALKRVQDRLGKNEQTPQEHTPVAFVDEVYAQAEKREFGYKDNEGTPWDENFVMWKFSDDSPKGSANEKKISFKFWDNKRDYDVEWNYDQESNEYLRNNGGEPFTDFYFDNIQVSAKNVVIQFVDERGPVDKEGHMFYTTVGEGNTLIFQNGEVITGTWEKTSREDRTRFFNEDGAEIKFVRGPIWIEAIPSGNEVDY